MFKQLFEIISKVALVVVHGGKAHLDDFLSCCLLMGAGAQNVVRRDPTKEELENPDVWCVDVGGSHNPLRRNFDHHHFPRGEEPRCALKLLFDFFSSICGPDLWKVITTISPKFHWINRVDCLGPMAVAKELGLSVEAFIGLYTDPITTSLLERFEQRDNEFHSMLSTEDLYMASIGKDLWNAMEEFGRYMTRYGEQVKILEFKGIKTLFLDEKDTKFLGNWKDAHASEAGILIAQDDRGEGWLLYRYNDHPRVNFSNIEKEPNVLFAHKGGFIAKTKTRVSLDEVKRLIEKSIIGEA